MTLVIKRLQTTLLANHPLGIDYSEPLNWDFSKSIKSLDAQSYRQLIPSHLILNMEYSLLGQQIRANLLTKPAVNEELLVGQLVSAIFLAELLEHIYQHYLIVPREVRRFQQQQQLYRTILKEIKGSLPAHWEPQKEFLESPSQPSQLIRGETVHVNLYRLLFIRSKRALDLIAAIDGSAYWYRFLIHHLDRLTDPGLPYVAWLFFMPRLSTNLFLLGKHTIQGSWMDKDEADLGWGVRLQGQLLRRWFELGNDLVWFSVGFINCFVLSGAAATYLGIVFFGYDVLLSALRVYIELNRLYELRKQYQDMNGDEVAQKLKAIDAQIKFEWLRLGSHLLITTGIFLAMCCGAPAFAATPLVPVVGALFLVAYCIVNFAMVPVIDRARPRDMIEEPKGGVSQLGFFAKRVEAPAPADENLDLGCCIS